MAMVQVISQLRLIERENQNESIIFRMLFWLTIKSQSDMFCSVGYNKLTYIENEYQIHRNIQ